MLLQRERAEAAKAEEEQYRQRELDKFALEDKVEQMNQQKRRLKVEEHKREAARLVAEKRALRMAEEVR